jgi:hypothetical protein
MNFSEHVVVMACKAFASLRCWDLSKDYHSSSEIHTLWSLYTSLVRPKLEYASCVWSPVYDVRVDKVERVQRRFIRYALRGLGWTDTYDLPRYEHRCARLRLGTLVKRHFIASIMFIFDILSVRMNAPNLLSTLWFEYSTISALGFRVSSDWFPSHELRGSWTDNARI